MQTIKAVAYCFPASHNAELLGNHGYYIQQQMRLEDGNLSEPYIEQGHNVFNDLRDPDLRQLFSEVDGEVSPYSLLLPDGYHSLSGI
jgi:hypothetical protein